MRKTIGWSVSICAAVAGIALAALPAMSAATATRTASRAAYATFPGRLYSVKAFSPGDAWAAGLEPSSSLIVHWDGVSWSRSLAGAGFFYSIGGSSGLDVWAVGGTNWYSPTAPLVEHFNGKSWSQVAAPDPAGGGMLTAVAATSPSNAWAVGEIGGGPGADLPSKPFIEHWDGTRWTIQPVQVPTDGGQFLGVSAVSATDAWAVGFVGPSGNQTLIEHWNGVSWTRVPSPNVGTKSSQFQGVTAVSSDYAWAVGRYEAANGSYRTLVEFWNGTSWKVVFADSPGGDAELLGVTATHPRNIWAVGMENPTTCSPQCQTLVEHWNSVRWKVLPSPNPPAGYLNVLLGVSGSTTSDVWAVGSTDYHSTLIEHWNGSSWSN